ncbi:MAG TPA: LLM class flavin-dependent oxidoreductase [Acidimicrobiia bacterium]|nr:LLM class flavin-dependent oxidoreductase [Acidimicrobiia bacterium]
MHIGLINQLHGRPGGDPQPPTWQSIRLRAEAAEEMGFDIFVFEDALLYRSEHATDGVWESVSIAGALAATTSRIRLGQSVVNSPYRSPAMTAKIAETLDEISGGRYVLGIGAGNTPESDYEAFGFPADRRYSRFAEAIQIVHALLKTGSVSFDGEFYSAREAEMVLRGPHAEGPPINIAAGGPRMLQLVARYGDAWNWWGYDETLDETTERLKPIINQLDAACESQGRDPSDIRRTLDVYTVIPPAFADAEGLPGRQPIAGGAEEIAEHLLSLGSLGFEEVRCDVWPKTPEAIHAMEEVVRLVHAA